MKGKVAAVGLAAVLAVAAPLVMKWEGVRHKPYQDAVGVWTVCYGHTKTVDRTRTYTQAECKALLDEDMAEANTHVRRCIPVPMLVQIESALTSLAFNVGPRVVCGGSSIRREALANNWPAACKAIDLYKYAGGRVLRGLVLRRADERELCETGR